MNIFFFYLVKAQIISEVNHFVYKIAVCVLKHVFVEKNSTISKYAVEPIPLLRNHISRSPRHIHPTSSPILRGVTPAHVNGYKSVHGTGWLCVVRGGGVRLPLICIPSPTRLSTAHIKPPPHPIHRITTDQKYPCPLYDCDERFYYIC